MTSKQFLKEWLQVFLLVVLTYNPTGYCYLVWVSENRDLPASVVLTLGFVLAAMYVYVVKSAISGLGKAYMVALFIFFILFFWSLIDLGIFDVPDSKFFIWLLILYLSLVLALGKVWPRLRKTSMLRSQKEKRTENKKDWLDGDW